MADGKIIIETDLDSSGIEKGISGLSGKFEKVGNIASKGMKAAATAITGTATALGGVAVAAIKVGSDFEVQMSRVQAISGATGDEFNNLRELAIQLGSDTSFSATEAAEGMENLAAAGFTTNEIMDAMPGMLSLAAASGEDLATSSDIAASTLRGFGLEASEAAHVADVLAENANRTNSSVSETGEAMKFIAPLAQAAGISFEETAAAIGIMANAGIQGSQAGTTLRGALSRLSKPTADMQQAMDELGISFYDSEGKMKSLSEQVGMLKDATEGMTDEQRNNYLVTLYGQEALSGMLALMNEGEDALEDLTKSYESCDGAAEKAAEIMRDNLAGALEELGGSAETLGITFYTSIAGTLKDTVKSVTQSVNNITKAFENGGIDAAVEQAGKEFANLATEAAKGAPKMVRVAVSFIQSFVSGIAENKEQLFSAAGDIAQALVDGLIQFLPVQIREPVRQAIDAIKESFTSGGLGEAVDSVATIFQNLMWTIGELADVALPLLTSALDLVGDHFEELVPLLTAAVTGYVAYKTAVTAIEAVTKLATTAQAAFNAVISGNPIALLVGVLAAATGGLVAFVASQEKASKKTDIANQKLAEQADAIRNMQDARAQAVEDIQSEYGYYEDLWNELQGIVDQNGKINEGYEERASFITSTLSNALGQEISITDGVIDKYSELQSSISQVIEKKRQEAILNAYQESYTEAVKKQADANSELVRTYNDLQTAEQNLETATNNLTEAQNSMTADVAAGSPEIIKLGNAQEEARQEVEKAEEAYNNAKIAAGEYTTTISNFEEAMGAVQSGSANAEAAITALTNGLIRSTGSNEAELSKQVETWRQKYEEMRAAAEAGNSGISDTMVQGTQAMWLMSQIELEKGTTNNKAKIAQYQEELAALFNTSPAKEAAGNSSKETMEAHAQGIESADVKTPVANKLNEEAAAWTENSGAAEAASQASGTGTAQAHVDGISGVDTATPAGEKGTEAGQYLANAAESQQAVVEAAGRDLVNAILNGMTQSDASTLMQQLGQQIVSGLSQGITANQGLVTQAVNALIESARNALVGANLSQTASEEGIRITVEMQNAISSGTPGVTSAIENLCSNVKNALTSAQIWSTAKEEGTRATMQMQNAITTGTPGVKSAVDNLCRVSKNALISARIWSTAKEEGTKATTQMKSAITTGTPGVVNAVKNLCTNSQNALKSAQLPQKFKTEATNMVKNFTAAIKDGTPGAANASKNLAIQTYNALKSVDLPAKGRNEGTRFGTGLASGINSRRGAATSAGSSLGAAAKNGLNSAGLYSAGYSIGAQLCSGIAAGISANAGAAAAAAANAAASAAAAARANLQIHSPSRVGIEIGRMFDKGIEKGIIDNTRRIEKASGSLADKIRRSVDLSDVTQGIRRAMHITVDRVTDRLMQDSKIQQGAEERTGTVDKSIHMVNNYNVPVVSPSEVARANRETARKLLGGVR